MMRSFCYFLVLGTMLLSCNSGSEKSADKSSDAATATMYYGGDIITMEGDSAQYAESVVVKDGKILFCWR